MCYHALIACPDGTHAVTLWAYVWAILLIRQFVPVVFWVYILAFICLFICFSSCSKDGGIGAFRVVRVWFLFPLPTDLTDNFRKSSCLYPPIASCFCGTICQDNEMKQLIRRLWFLFGRCPDCHIKLYYSDVGKYHCLICGRKFIVQRFFEQSYIIVV